MKSLNSFADHAPKPEWLRSFFELKDDVLFGTYSRTNDVRYV